MQWSVSNVSTEGLDAATVWYLTVEITISKSSSPSFPSLVLTRIRAPTMHSVRVQSGSMTPSTMCALVAGLES